MSGKEIQVTPLNTDYSAEQDYKKSGLATATEVTEKSAGIVIPGEKPPEKTSERPLDVDPRKQVYEDLARQWGWKPKAEFKEGDNKHFVDAEEFVKNEHNINRVVLEKNEALKNKVTELGKTVNDIHEYHKKAREAEISKLKAQLEEERKQAILESDIEKVDQVEKNIKDLDKEKISDEPQNQNKEVFAEWHGKNEWYEKNTELSEIADAIARSERDKNPDVTITEVLSKIDKTIKPLLENKTAQKESTSNTSDKGEHVMNEAAVAGGVSNIGRTSGNEMSFEELPQLAKETCQRFEKTIPKFTREQFLKDYQKVDQ